jgi:hypothetical protein
MSSGTSSNAPRRANGRRGYLTFLAALVVAASATRIRAEVSPEAIGNVVTNHQDAVLFLSGTVKFLCGRCTQIHQFPVRTTAVVTDSQGLLLAASVGPLADPKTEIRDSTLHVRMPDGAEVPVRVAVTDEDLEVVVLKAERAEDVRAHPFKPLDLESPARARPLDELVVLRRHDAGANYLVSAATVRVNAVESKPLRTYFSAGLPEGQGISPCFNLEGRLVALGIGEQTAIATDELADLVVQARSDSRPPPESP